MKTKEQQIAELKKIQAQEEANNFQNGDLWNECEDKITALKNPKLFIVRSEEADGPWNYA